MNQAQQLNLPGAEVLFSPERFQMAVPCALNPLQPDPDFGFPFAIPIQQAPGAQGNQGQIRCTRLCQAVESTGRAMTATPTAISTMQGPQNPRARKLFKSDVFWENVYEYARMDVLPTDPPTLRTNNYHLIHNVPRIFQFPSKAKQIGPVRSLWHWHQKAQSNMAGIAVESEPAVQDQVYSQLLGPLNIMLRTRYDSESIQVDLSPQIPVVVQYPHWGRPTKAVHKVPAMRDGAGYPDHILYFERQKGCNTVTCEVKTWWSYPDVLWTDMFDGTFRTANHGFDWDSANNIDPRLRTIKQIWGELVFFDCTFGFWTNGSVVVLCCRTSPDTLTVSDPKPWNHPQVLVTLFGLSCLGVDTKFMDAQTTKAVVDIIIPVVSRQ